MDARFVHEYLHGHVDPVTRPIHDWDPASLDAGLPFIDKGPDLNDKLKEKAGNLPYQCTSVPRLNKTIMIDIYLKGCQPWDTAIPVISKPLSVGVNLLTLLS